MPQHNAVENRPGRLQLGLGDPQLLHRVAVEYVDAAAAVDEDSREAAGELVGDEGWIQHQRVATWSWHDGRMVLAPPRNGPFGLVHVLRNGGHDGVYFHHTLSLAALVVALAGEYDVGRVLVREITVAPTGCMSRLLVAIASAAASWGWRWRRQRFALT